jgi:hypothetical protein
MLSANTGGEFFGFTKAKPMSAAVAKATMMANGSERRFRGDGALAFGAGTGAC